MERITMNSLVNRISCEADAYGYLEELRWPNGPVCPHCQGTKAYFLTPKNGLSRATRTGTHSQRRVWKCAKCRKQFSVTTGTIFHGSRVPLTTWLQVFFEMCSNKNGLAAREVERRYGVHPKTAWLMTQKIREAMADRAPEKMVGTIVADEAYIGGAAAKMNAKRREAVEAAEPPSRAFHARPLRNHLTPIMTLVDADTGEVRTKVVTNVRGATLKKVIAEQVDMARSHLHTDEAPSYNEIGSRFLSHGSVSHRRGVYVDPESQATTNQAENYFSQLKRSLDGTHHNVSKVHLQRYLNEFDFRYSTKHLTDTERVHRLMGRTGRRISYRRVKG